MPDRAATDRSSPHSTAWLLVFTLGFLWLFPMLLLRGMSLDGVTFATVSRNLAVGIGDTWHLFYTAGYGAFYEQPPLGLVVESWAFRLFGDQWWVERLYSVATALPTACILVLIWRRLVRHAPQFLAFSWLPIALWVSLPAWPWIYRNNYLENTLGIFSALAVYASLRAVAATRWWAAWTALAAASILAAMFCKGPVGLFPLVTPALAALSMREQGFRKILLVQATLAILLVAALGLVLAQRAPREFLAIYFNQQVLDSLRGRREVVDSPLGQFRLPWLLFQDLLPSGAIAAACVVASRWLRATPEDGALRGLRGPTLFCLWTGASASIPIMISPKQSAYYAAPSWPFYALALALWCGPSVEALLRRAGASAAFAKANRRLRVAACAAMALTALFSPLWAGSMCRDQRIIHDVQRIAEVLDGHSSVALDAEMAKEWSLQAYLYRMYFISAKLADRQQCETYHLDFAHPPHTLPSGYRAIDSGTTLYRLSKRLEVTARLEVTTLSAGAAPSRNQESAAKRPSRR